MLLFCVILRVLRASSFQTDYPQITQTTRKGLGYCILAVAAGVLRAYLNASGLDVGVLVNFGHYPGLEYQRLANTRKKIKNHPPNQLNAPDAI